MTVNRCFFRLHYKIIMFKNTIPRIGKIWSKGKSFASMALIFIAATQAQAQKTEVDYVNPYMGNISHLLVPTYPTVQLPNSLLRVYPERADYKIRKASCK